MQVRDGMTPMALTVGPEHTLRAVARLMAERNVGAAVVIDPEGKVTHVFRKVKPAEHDAKVLAALAE